MNFWRFVDKSELSLITGQYDIDLMIVSWMIGSTAVLSALHLPLSNREYRTAWIVLGSLSLGLGLGAMHFIWLKSFALPGVMSYDPLLSGLSVALLLVGAYICIALSTLDKPGIWRLQFAAIVFSGTINFSHYLALESVTLVAIEFVYNPGQFLFSLSISYVLALIALTVCFLSSSGERIVKLVAAGLTGFLIGVQYYSLMLVPRFYLAQEYSGLSGMGGTDRVIPSEVLFVSGAVITFVLIMSHMERRLIGDSSASDPLADILPDGLIRVNSDFRVISSNPAARAMFDYPEEKFHRLYVSQLMPGWSWELFDKSTGRKPFTTLARSRVGAEFMLEARLVAQHINGEKQRVMIIRDVSERQAEQVHLSRLTAAMDQAVDAILVVSPEQETIFANENMKCLIRDSLKRLDIRDFLNKHPDVRNQLDKNDLWRGNHEFQGRDDLRKCMDVCISTVRDKDEAICAYVMVCRDIGDLKDAENALVDAVGRAENETRLKGSYLAMLGYEIRTPLNSIMGLSAMLADKCPDDAQRTTLNLLLQSSESLITTVNNVVDYSRIETGEMVIEESILRLQELLLDVVNLHKARAGENDIRIVLNFEDEMPARVYGDATRIRQVITNLLDNAIKFSHMGEITITVSSKFSFVPNLSTFRISVIDSGIGIDESTRDRVFEPFMQADKTTTRRTGGTGLGLAISRQLVELMGGKIGASSVEGVGSVFWFELPLAVVTENGKSSDQSREIIERYEGLEILLAEDNPINQMVTARMLRKFGCRVDNANDGKVCVEMSRHKAYEIILMDCNMPELDGFEATMRIRKDELNPSRNAPIVAITARAMEGDRELCLAAGMSDYVAKPVRAMELTSVLDRWTRLQGGIESEIRNLSAPK